MSERPISGSYRPSIMGTHGMVASGHYLATQAGARILARGGNAVDAGVAAGLCLTVLHIDMVNLAGVAPIIVYLAEEDRVLTISGLGRWPKAASVAYFKEHCGGKIPPGVLRCITPGSPDAWITALERYGTLSLAEVMEEALRLAAEGFPMHPLMASNLRDAVGQFTRWPSSAAVLMPKGRLPEAGEIFAQPDLARTIRRLLDAESGARQAGRQAGLRAARDLFYRGDIAREIAAFYASQGGLLTYDDLAAFQRASRGAGAGALSRVRGLHVRSLVSGTGAGAGADAARGLRPCRARPQLAGLRAPRHRGAQARLRRPRALLRRPGIRRRAHARPALGILCRGAPAAHRSRPRARRDAAGRRPAARHGSAAPWSHLTPAQPAGVETLDTTYVCAVDRRGNIFSATPSDGCLSAPVTPGTGLGVSSRGSQSWVVEGHPSSVAPGKRPRLTPCPAIVFKDGKPFMPLGTPGGDVQCQAMLQVFLNIAVFGMAPQAAIEAPRFATYSYPGSFEPHEYHADELRVERGLAAEIGGALTDKGHKLVTWPDWTWKAGGVCTITIDHASGVLAAGADPRRMGYAIGW